jgi:hypothetical protein
MRRAGLPRDAIRSQLMDVLEAQKEDRQCRRLALGGYDEIPVAGRHPPRNLEIQNHEEFLYDYDHILTPKVKAKIPV